MKIILVLIGSGCDLAGGGGGVGTFCCGWCFSAVALGGVGDAAAVTVCAAVTCCGSAVVVFLLLLCGL